MTHEKYTGLEDDRSRRWGTPEVVAFALVENERQGKTGIGLKQAYARDKLEDLADDPPIDEGERERTRQVLGSTLPLLAMRGMVERGDTGEVEGVEVLISKRDPHIGYPLEGSESYVCTADPGLYIFSERNPNYSEDQTDYVLALAREQERLGILPNDWEV